MRLDLLPRVFSQALFECICGDGFVDRLFCLSTREETLGSVAPYVVVTYSVCKTCSQAETRFFRVTRDIIEDGRIVHGKPEYFEPTSKERDEAMSAVTDLFSKLSLANGR